MKNRILTTLLLLSLCVPVFSMADFRPFNTGSLKQIVTEHKGQPFLLVLWSVDCPPCLRELEHLGKLRNSFPGQGLVLISTDSSDYRNDAEALLALHGLKDAENWVFTGNFPEKLRYHIDNSWFGELPRSYFYDANHQRISRSGVLNMEVIQQWITTMKQTTAATK